MSAPVLILSQSPSITKMVAAPLARRLHASEVFVLHTLPFGAARFAFPRGLTFSDYPLTGAPRYRPNPSHPWMPMRLHMDGALEAVANVTPLRLLAAARSVVACVDLCSGSRAALAATLELTENSPRTMPSIDLRSLDREAIETAVARMEETILAIDTDGMTAAGAVKRRFEYGWAMNAQAILGATARSVGLTAPASALSKYAIQTLYGLARRAPMKPDDVLLMMYKWNGTGKWGHGSLGSARSHAAIVDNLLRMGAIEKCGRKFQVANGGWRLLDALHPNCEDADLPMRLEQWMAAARPGYRRSDDGFQASCDGIDRWLRSWFGRQRRFLAKGGLSQARTLSEHLLSPPARDHSEPSPDCGWPYSLSALQMEMADKHRWSARKTLVGLEGLHVAGLITEPRVDERRAPLTVAAVAADVATRLAELPELAEEAARIDPRRRAPCWDDACGDQQAILPTWRPGSMPLSELKGEWRELYLAIALRYLRQFTPAS